MLRAKDVRFAGNVLRGPRFGSTLRPSEIWPVPLASFGELGRLFRHKPIIAHHCSTEISPCLLVLTEPFFFVPFFAAYEM